MKKNISYLITGKIYHDEVSNLNIYPLNTRAQIFEKETFLNLKSHITSHMLILEDLNTPFSPMDCHTES